MRFWDFQTFQILHIEVFTNEINIYILECFKWGCICKLKLTVFRKSYIKGNDMFDKLYSKSIYNFQNMTNKNEIFETKTFNILTKDFVKTISNIISIQKKDI